MIRSTPCVPLCLMLLAHSAAAGTFRMPEGMDEAQQQRFKLFESFQIKGVCGDEDLERLSKLGVNTVRGYTIGEPASVRAKLDEAQRLGMKVILSEWMPHHGENRSKEGHVWNFDYHAKGDAMVEAFTRKLEAIGDHPAILMWGLGNEVHLDEPYLRVVNRMSESIHHRFPHHVTSLTMVNARPEAIEAVKRHAPDLDVLGIQSYSLGAVRGAIRKTEELWGKPFYMSEFNTKGPWNFQKTAWGVGYDEPATLKLADLQGCYDAIDASPLCLGSTIFVWSDYSVGDRPTYFSLLLDPRPERHRRHRAYDELLITPQADLMARHFTKRPLPGNQAPALSRLAYEDGAACKEVSPGQALSVRFAAVDPDGDEAEFSSYVLLAKASRVEVVAGPHHHGKTGSATVNAPAHPGEFLLMVYARDGKGGASASTLPFKVSPLAR